MSTPIAVSTMRRWREQPQVFVREVFGVTPDPWQDKVLSQFPTQPRIAMKACKGPGKSALMAWLGWNFLCTRPHPKCAATSITADTLKDTLWAEFAKWQNKSDFLKATFEWQQTRIFAREAPETWFMSARSWARSASAEQQADTLAGLHADYILFLIDEAGGIPDSVMAAAEAALSSCIEGHLVIGGNPTHLAGPLYRACTTEKNLWHVVEITGDPDDPMRSPRISIQWAREQIQKYGKDNPFVLVNVFGRFPPGSLNALIGPDEVSDAMKRIWRPDQYAGAARILGVDVARFGDDKSVIFPRQGLVAFEPKDLRNADSVQGAGAVARMMRDWEADACFVDNTGGYGAGWIDQLIVLKFSPIGVGFATKANDQRYFNKRAEIYFEMVEWIKRGGALPPNPQLTSALTQTCYTFKGDKFLLEPKDIVKAKIGFSPDEADALALTFSQPVSPKTRRSGVHTQHQVEYDPLHNMHNTPGPESRGHQSDYVPFR